MFALCPQGLFFFFKETLERFHLHFELELWVKAFLFYRKLSKCWVIWGGQGWGRVNGDRRRDNIEEWHLVDFWCDFWCEADSSLLVLWKRDFGKPHRKLITIPTNHTVLVFSSIHGWAAGGLYPLYPPSPTWYTHIAVALYSASSLLCFWFLHFASGWKGHSLEK